MNNTAHDKVRCIKILGIRAAACARLGIETQDKCPTCGRLSGSPYFRTDARGHGIEGCVDAHHSQAYLTGEVARWFARPAAQAIRATELTALVRA